jgi:putative sigma-54 modulation protein
MRFIISGRGVTVGPALRARVERKVGRLARILPKLLEARVVLSAEKYRRTAELTLLAKRRTFRSEETAEDFSSAVDRAMEALERQVRRTKERLHGRKSRQASSGIRTPRALAPPSSGDGLAEETHDLVPRRLVSKPMSVEEAVMQFGLGKDQFLVFTNSSSKRVNVLYRKSDGTMGLIDPIT